MLDRACAFSGGACLRVVGPVFAAAGAADRRGARVRVLRCDVPLAGGARLRVSLAARGTPCAPVLWLASGRCVSCCTDSGAPRLVPLGPPAQCGEWRLETWELAAAEPSDTLASVGLQFAGEGGGGGTASVAVDARIGELCVWAGGSDVAAVAVTDLRAAPVWEAESTWQGAPQYTVQLSWAAGRAGGERARCAYWDVYEERGAGAPREWAGRAAGPCYDVPRVRAAGGPVAFIVVPLDALGAPQDALAGRVQVDWPPWYSPDDGGGGGIA